MPPIILKERTAQLASYTFFTRGVDQYKNTSLSRLYQPPRISFSQNTYHQLRSSCEYCKVFKKSCFIEHLQKQSLADALHNRFITSYFRHVNIAKFLRTTFLCNTSHKQPPEVFYEKRCSQKFHKCHRKAPVPEPHFQ